VEGLVSDRSDVVVIGGGMAGCMAALMLRRRGLTVTVLESRRRDEPQKIVVGEAITEGSTLFFWHELGFRDWLDANAFRKFGFDFLVQPRHEGAPTGPTPDECHELLMSLVPLEKIPTAFGKLIPTYHVERPAMNAELLRRAVEAGADVRHGAKVTEVVFGEGTHEVRYEDADGPGVARGAWVYDCSGWRGQLARQLGIRRHVDALPTASVWNRFRNVDASPETWRTFAGIDRRRQTIHFCGAGFWIWWIHQRDGSTSVGVSYDTRQHQPDKQTPDRGFWEMIRKFPAVARALEHAEPLESFQGYGHLPHGCEHWVSARGYAIIGDAAWFVDALYSTAIETAARQLVATLPLVQAASRGERVDEVEVARLNDEFDHLQRAVLAHNRFKYEEAWHRPHVLFQVALYELSEIAELYNLQRAARWRPEVLARHYRLQWGTPMRVRNLEAFMADARADADRDLRSSRLLRKGLTPTLRVFLATYPLWVVPDATPTFFRITKLWGFLERWSQRYAWWPDLLALTTPPMPEKRPRVTAATPAVDARG
jgi:flavin-dependent dehydrogenase